MVASHRFVFAAALDSDEFLLPKLMKMVIVIERIRFLFLLAVFCFFSLSVGAQWIYGYSYRKSITINMAELSAQANLLGFPLLVNVTDELLIHSDECNPVKSNQGYDVLFAQPDGTVLEHSLNTYDSQTGSLSAWVKIPRLTQEENTLYMYYGRRDQNQDPSKNTVWGEDFNVVLSFDSDPRRDASPNADHFSNTGGDNSLTGGVSGAAGEFTGSGMLIHNNEAGKFSSSSSESFSVSGWLKCDSKATEEMGAFRTTTIVASLELSTDDAEQGVNTTNISTANDDLDFGSEFDQYQIIGLRYSNLNIPPNARIVDAYIEFYAIGNNTESTRSGIYIEDSTNPVTFGTGESLVTARSKASVSQVWMMPPWTSGKVYRTPDLKDLVQYMVDREGWTSGNAMAFLLESQGRRIALGRESGTGSGPQLIVEFESTDEVSEIILPVNHNYNDAEELTSGAIDLNGSLSLGNINNAFCGVRFSAVPIHRGAVIESAHIEFTSSGISSSQSNYNIYADDTPDSAPFANTTGNLSNRQRTSGVSWSTSGWTTGGVYATADLKEMVQGIIDKEGWQAGNALAFLIASSGTTFAKSARGFGSPTTYGPTRLVIRYSYLSSPEKYVLSEYSGSHGYRLWVGATGRLGFGFDNDEVWNPDVKVNSVNRVNDSEWHHFTAVKHKNDSLSIFLDGEFEASRGIDTKLAVRTVASSTDDAEQPTQWTYTTQQTLDLGFNWVGMRFVNMEIPAGSEVVNAYLVVNSTMGLSGYDGDDLCNLVVTGEKVANATTYGDNELSIGSRRVNKTATSVNWTFPDMTSTGMVKTTGSIREIVQEIIDQPGWASGNAMAFFIEAQAGGTGTRRIKAYDQTPNAGPTLVVEYRTQPFTMPEGFNPLLLGGDQSEDNSSRFLGAIDELMFFNTEVTADWVKAHYSNLANSAAFMAYSDQESVSWTGAGGQWSEPSNWNTGIVPWYGADVFVGSEGSSLEIDADVVFGKLQIEQDNTVIYGGSNITLLCGLENNGVFTATQGTVEFAGEASPQLIQGSGSTTFYDLLISTGSQPVIVRQDITVDHSFVLAEGAALKAESADITFSSPQVLDAMKHDLLAFVVADNTSTVNVRGVADGETVNLPLAFEAAAESYAGITFTNRDGSSQDFSITICDGFYTDGTCNGSLEGKQVNKSVVNQIWDIGTLSTHAEVEFFWHASNELAEFNRDYAYVLHHNGGEWELIGSASQAVAHGGDIYSLAAEQFSFSPDGVGNEDGSILPVEFVNFSGQRFSDDAVQLQWETAFEKDNDFFVVERSFNGKDFVEIGRKPGAGNSARKLSYSHLDAQAEPQAAYYRIKQVDFDGKESFSPVIRVEESMRDFDFKIFPNPVHQNVSLTVMFHSSKPAGPVKVMITDLTGRRIYSNETVSVAAEIEIPASEGMVKGTYLLVVSAADYYSAKRVVVY